jgi:hypothetical protein
MRSIKHRFDEIAERNPGLSSYICFARTVTGQGYNQSMIRRWFNKLVNKEDYDASENKTVHFPHFYSLTQEKEARGLPAGRVKTPKAK